MLDSWYAISINPIVWHGQWRGTAFKMRNMVISLDNVNLLDGKRETNIEVLRRMQKDRSDTLKTTLMTEKSTWLV